MADFTYKIIEHIAVLQTKKGGWCKELTLCSFNGLPAKYDIREWRCPDYDAMGKGCTLTQEEMDIIIKAMEGRR